MIDLLDISFYQPAAGWQALSDQGFLQAVAWKRSAPAEIVSAARQGDLGEFCRLMQQAGRAPIAAGKPQEAVRSCRRVLWSQSGFDPTERQQQLIDLLDSFTSPQRRQTARSAAGPAKKNAQRQIGSLGGRTMSEAHPLAAGLTNWLDGAASAPTGPFELLTLLELLTNLGPKLPQPVFWKLWRTALTASAELSCELADPQDAGATDDQRLLVLGELPWLAGLVFAGVRGAGKLHRQGRAYLNARLLDRTDEQGAPHADLLSRLPLWLAPLVRTVERTGDDPARLWTGEEPQQRFRKLVEAVVPLCRPDGRLALSNGAVRDPAAVLLQSALASAGFERKSPWVKYLTAVEKTFGNTAGRRAKGAASGAKSKAIQLTGRPAAQSDWGRWACLRSDLTTAADSLVVAHQGERPLIELLVRGTPLLAGRWEVAVTLDSQPLALEPEWECVCWYSDADADYLELQMHCPPSIRIERQLMLSRTERWLLLADSISGAGDRRIDYTSRLPLADGLEGCSQTRSRECVVNGKSAPRPLARVFPLALPQDRVLSTPGGFGPFGRDLVLKQAAQGNGLYAPLVIDWKRRRRRSPAEWRTLTVTEDGRILPGDEAAGHRLRIGDHHLVVFRSLKNSDHPRALLGHQTYHESVIGNFESTGQVSPIVMVEGASG